MFLSFNIKSFIKPICIALAFLMLFSLFAGFYNKSQMTFSFNKEKLPSLKAETEEERQELIKELGWCVREIYSSEEVMIPKEFDEIYLKYNDLQKKQGLNLLRHRGKTARKYTYFLENFPENEDVRLTFLVRKGKVIGGDVCSLGKNGFMRTLFYPEEGVNLENSSSML